MGPARPTGSLHQTAPGGKTGDQGLPDLRPIDPVNFAIEMAMPYQSPLIHPHILLTAGLDGLLEVGQGIFGLPVRCQQMGAGV